MMRLDLPHDEVVAQPAASMPLGGKRFSVTLEEMVLLGLLPHSLPAQGVEEICYEPNR
jgi:hypothetical protein